MKNLLGNIIKHMKKIVLIIFIIFFTNSLAYASGDCSSCTIKEAPAQVLQKYLENQKKVISKIKSKVWGKTVNYSTDELTNMFSVSINQLLDFNTYFSDFEYIRLELFTSVPKEIKRDKLKIEKELTNVENEIERSIKRKYAWVTVSSKDICQWIDNCTLSWTVISVLTDIAKNNIQVLALYKNSIIWQNQEKFNFILVPNTFYDDLIKSYNKNTLMNCSQCEWWTFNDISKKVKEIAKNMKDIGNSTKYWTEWWNLLTWNVTEAELKKLEKDLLTKELANQWLTKSQSQIILDNLDKYYEKTSGWWFSTENNFISNSIAHITNSLWNYIDLYKEVLSHLKEEDIKDKWVTQNEITQNIQKLSPIEILSNKMNEMYSPLIKEASMQSIVDENWIYKLITIHASLIKLIENLKNTIWPAQSVCKKQCKWNGNCTDY